MLPVILVDKSASPSSRPEPGGQFTFNVVVSNTGPEALTITALTDDVYGNLATQGTCTTAVGTVLQPGQSYSCAFTANFTGNAGASQTDVVTATGADDDGNTVSDTDDATVTLTGVPPTVQVVKTATPLSLPEPGGQFTFNVVVTNTSATESITITALTDDVYGNLNGRGTCAIGAVLAPGATYSCSFSAPFNGQAGATQRDVVTVRGVDDDGQDATDDDDAVVSLTDVPPVLTLVKTATPLVRNEPGGSFTFDVVITNPGTEAVTITSLTDDVYGNLDGRGTCAVGAVLAPNGGTYRCSFTGDFIGNAGASQTDTVTASGVDDDGSRTTARDDAIVRLVDIPPTLTVVKDADPISRPEPGGSFTFTVVITNTSFEPVTVVSITDDVYGNLNGRGTCAVGAVLQPGASYRCQFTVEFRGAGGASQVDRVFATVVDNDGTRASANDDARISITPVAAPLPRTGTDVHGPARLAFGLLLAGMLLIGVTMRRRNGLAVMRSGSGVALFTGPPTDGGFRRLLGGGGSRATAWPEEVIADGVVPNEVEPDEVEPDDTGPDDDGPYDFAPDDVGPDDLGDETDPGPDDEPPFGGPTGGGGGGGGGTPPVGRGPTGGGSLAIGPGPMAPSESDVQASVAGTPGLIAPSESEAEASLGTPGLIAPSGSDAEESDAEESDAGTPGLIAPSEWDSVASLDIRRPVVPTEAADEPVPLPPFTPPAPFWKRRQQTDEVRRLI